MPDYFWIDGKRCDSVGLRLQSLVTFSSPVPKVTSISVAGRNGDLHIYDGSFENITGTAKCFALKENSVNESLNAITRWCLLEPGYHRLSVSSEPEHFRLASVSVGPENEIRMRTLAPFSIKFDCMPQKFLKTGERTITLTKSKEILRNPGFTALPLIKVYGNAAGTLTISSVVVQIKSISEYVVLDCDTQNAYKGLENKNSTINAPEFPVLRPGDNMISWTGGIAKVEITPRWWTL